VSPRARRNPLEGGEGREPSSEAEPARGGREPSSEAEPARRGVPCWAAVVGRRGHRGVGRALCACLDKRCVMLLFFLQVLSRIHPSLLGDPRVVPDSSPEHLWVYLLGSRRCWSLLIGRSSLLVANAFCGAASVLPQPWRSVSAPAAVLSWYLVSGCGTYSNRHRQCSSRLR
jgi:hypothetical protein